MYSAKARNQPAEGMGKVSESSPETTSARRCGSRDASHSDLLFFGVGGYKLYRMEGGIGEGNTEPADACEQLLEMESSRMRRGD